MLVYAWMAFPLLALLLLPFLERVEARMIRPDDRPVD